MYPEFTGTVTSSLIKPPMTGLSNNPETVYEAAKAGISPQLIEDVLRRFMRESYSNENQFGLKP